HMNLARRQDWRARNAAVDHSRWYSTSTPEGGLGPIWQYWAQGLANAPPLVKACMRSVQRHKGDRDLIVLDDTTVTNYVDLPGHIWDKRRRQLMNSQQIGRASC
ncbi:capsular polysaccharide synthesis protein, partial [Mesorhizobium sp. M4B.F.Ca.ET.203.01.1.1]|uniref:capsular polysaccharide synthesis protein n=1 Tax=Mesorhizobium sp. M4B.F.Ca.ET.203.01.1.1 TaxID=2563953 RepID=UPI001AEF2912